MKTLFISNDPTLFDEANPAVHLAMVGDLPTRMVEDLARVVRRNPNT